MDNNFNLFDTKADEPILPSEDQNLNEGMINPEDIQEQLKSGAELISTGIERAIGGEVVNSMMIGVELDIALPNYVLDIQEVKPIAEFHMHAIDSLLSPDGDTVIYAYTGELVKIGKGKSIILDRILATSMDKLFSGKCKVYKDFQSNKQPVLVSNTNISSLRLDL